MIKYFSYDIFDTCLVRSCGHPDAVFDVLATQILGPDAPLPERMDFSLERIMGERRSREKLCHNGIEDVTLQQIYEECDFSLWTETDKDTILNEELAIELQVLTPVKSIVDEISEKRENGGKIIFISDMYLPHSFLEKVLRINGIMKDDDSLYVSNEYSATKESGRLFDYVAKDLRINKREWLHTGDNLQADLRIPKQKGLRTRHIKHNLTYYERLMPFRELGGADFDATKFASISRSLILKYGDDAQVLFAADFVAPVYIPFVYGIMKHASEHGYRHLYFLSRDGYILMKIAEIFCPDFSDIDIHYLCVSRNSLYLPGLAELTYDSISHSFIDLRNRNITYILDRLQLSDYNYSHFDIEGKNGEQILSKLLSDSVFFQALTQKWKEQKSLCYTYFEQEGLTQDTVAIVDLAGTRRCHVAINNILFPNNVFGYYLMVGCPREKGKNYYSLNYKERCARNSYNSLFMPQYLFEQYFSACTQKKTISYKKTAEGTIVPVFEDELADDNWKKKIEKTNIQICQEFAKQYRLLLSDVDCNKLCGLGMAAYTDFFHAPDYKYLQALTEVVFCESKDISWKVLEKRAWYSRCTKNVYWKKADIVYNNLFPNLMTKMYRLALLLHKFGQAFYYTQCTLK